jgi:hypothetical protein
LQFLLHSQCHFFGCTKERETDPPLEQSDFFLRRFFFLTLLYTPPTPQPPTTKCKSPIGNLSQTIRNHTFTKGCLPPTVKIHNHSSKYPKTQRERERERERIEEPVRSQKKLHEEGSSKSHHISLGFKLAVKPITTVKN